MRTIKLTIVFTCLFCMVGFSQTKFPLVFRVEKQAMSTPMSLLADMFFIHYYDTKPVNINFDGTFLNLYYDNGTSLVKKNVTEVNRDAEYENNTLTLETILYTDNSKVSDTISLVIDHSVGYVQLALPTKNSKGEYIGYTCYKKFLKGDELAMK
jgi:hypothetical protein